MKPHKILFMWRVNLMIYTVHFIWPIDFSILLQLGTWNICWHLTDLQKTFRLSRGFSVSFPFPFQACSFPVFIKACWATFILCQHMCGSQCFIWSNKGPLTIIWHVYFILCIGYGQQEYTIFLSYYKNEY